MSFAPPDPAKVVIRCPKPKPPNLREHMRFEHWLRAEEWQTIVYRWRRDHGLSTGDL